MKKIISLIFLIFIVSLPVVHADVTNFPNGINVGDIQCLSSIQTASVNANATTSMTATASVFIYTNAETISTSNFVLPSSPIDGQIAYVLSVPIISTMTVTAGSKTVKGGATSMTANGVIGYLYKLSVTTWYRFI